jgi:hypothetical protein
MRLLPNGLLPRARHSYVAGVIAVATLGTAAVFTGAQPASAAPVCYFAGTAFDNSTYAYGVDPAGPNYACPRNQARIDRYYAGVVRIYTGPIASTSNTGTHSEGYNAGNGIRGGDAALSAWLWL